MVFILLLEHPVHQLIATADILGASTMLQRHDYCRCIITLHISMEVYGSRIRILSFKRNFLHFKLVTGQLIAIISIFYKHKGTICESIQVS